MASFERNYIRDYDVSNYPRDRAEIDPVTPKQEYGIPNMAATDARKLGVELSAFLCDLAKSNPGDNRQILEWAAALDPASHRPHTGLGVEALAAKDAAKAAGHFFEALTRDPSNPMLGTNLAAAHDVQRHFDVSLRLTESALSVNPRHIPAYVQRVSAYEQLERFGDAIAAAEQGLEIDPTNDELHFGHALMLLREGEYWRAWPEFERRASRLTLCEQLDEYPEWNGEPLDGKTILVCCEWGLGDQIMFARYLPALVNLGARVVYKCPEALARLMAWSFSGVQVVTSDAELADIEPDYWVAMLSLPLRLEWPTPRECPEYVDSMMQRSPYPFSNNGKLRVGLCWEGTSGYSRAAERAVPFDALRPLLDTPGVEFVSLQYGPTEAQNDRIPNAVNGCHDIADTAAVIANLDLVITSDCMIANLAGAMGKAVWVLLGRPSDWRWGHEAVTPWYPTAHLFRKSKDGEWADAVDQVRTALFSLVKPHVRRTISEAPRALATLDCRYGPMSFYSADRWLGRSLERYGEWSEGEVDLFRHLLKPGDTVVEAGANIGCHTVPLSHIVGSAGTVMAFEPQPKVFRECLMPNTDGSPAHLVLVTRALGNGGPGTVSEFDPGNPGGCTVDGGIPLDDWKLTALDFLKIDVEGAELSVLQGAEHTIAKYRPFIYVEDDRPGSRETLYAWLTEHGYRVYQHFIPLFSPANFRGNKLNVFGKIVSAMLLGVPKERYGIKPQLWGLERMRAKNNH